MTSDRDPVFAIRMPADLKEQLQRAADESGRSMTKEILLRLSQSFTHDPAELEARIEALEEQMRELQPLIEQSRSTRRNRPK
jgi:polyhydroxyalkanoate synthesis regulator phasin